MEANLKKVMGDLNKSRGVGNGNGAEGSSGAGGGSAVDNSNPVSKVMALYFDVYSVYYAVYELVVAKRWRFHALLCIQNISWLVSVYAPLYRLL